jgi:hypothetical protein
MESLMRGIRTSSGPQSLEQSRQHFLDFDEFAFSFLVSADVQHFKITREQKKILKFARRTQRNMQKLPKFSSAPPAATFSDIGWYGTGGAAYLAAETKSFVGRQFAGELVRLEGQSMTPAPNLQLTEILHYGASLGCVIPPLNYLQLTTNNCQLFREGSHAD